MGLLLIVALLVALAGAVVLIATRKGVPDVHAGQRRTVRRLGIVAVGLGALVVVVVVAVSVVDTFRRRGLPPPEYPSLVTAPDPSLRGSVAYLAQKKSPATGFQACARVAPASGAPAKDVYCWPSDGSPIATTVWRPDGRLLVTSFDAPVGENRVIPKWAKLVDTTTGATEDVPKSAVGDHARPSSGPAKNPDGERLVRTGGNGTAEVALVGPRGSRTVFSVKDANPDWGIQTGPVFSPDFAWILMWDGNRLLLTTLDQSPETRVLADDALGEAFNYDVPTFAITQPESGVVGASQDTSRRSPAR